MIKEEFENIPLAGKINGEKDQKRLEEKIINRLLQWHDEIYNYIER